jgi:hypothetical protein
VIDDFQSYENAVAPTRPAVRLVRHISQAFRAQFARTDDEAERAAILRETFCPAANGAAAQIPSAPLREANEGDDQSDLVLRAGWQRNDANRLEIGWSLVPGVPDPETLLRDYSKLMMRRRSQPRLGRHAHGGRTHRIALRVSDRLAAAFGSGLTEVWHS